MGCGIVLSISISMFVTGYLGMSAQKIILGRDQYKSPLYYHLSKDKLIFASEIRAVKH